MRIAPICVLLGVICTPLVGDAADDTLSFLLAKTDLAVVGEIVSEPRGIVHEAGVVNYICKVKVLEVLKGRVSKTENLTENLSVNIIRFENVEQDRLPWLKKGAKCILFLKSVGPNTIPPWETVDVWFGVQQYGPWMARSLKRLGRPETRENPRTAAVVFANQFRSALAKADTKAMQELYAPEVTLKKGSELLKPQWGIPGAGDRSKDLVVGRDELIGGYRRMIEKIGRDKWSKLFSEIGEKDVYFSFATADDPGRGVRKGDLTMRVSTGPGDDALFFVLRREDSGHWRVVAEATDY